VPPASTGEDVAEHRDRRVAASLTSAAIPWDAFGKVRRLGLQTQALKSALAAGLAWAVGAYVPWGPPQPYLAPLTAILTIQATVAESLQGALQRVLGAAVGVGVAVLASHTIGVTPWTVALLVLVSQAVGSLLRLTIVGTSQVVVSALLVLTIGQASENGWLYGWGRLAETMVGALVGIAVNGLVAPPSYASEARRSWQSLADELAEQLGELARGLSTGLPLAQAHASLERARTLGDRLEAARAALAQAERSLRFNVVARAQRHQLARYRLALDSLEHAAIQLRGIARVLADLLGVADGCPPWLQPETLGQPLGRLTAAAAATLDTFSQVVLYDDLAVDAREAARRDDDAAEARRLAIEAAATQMPTIDPDGLIALGAILADLHRMIRDLTSARIAVIARPPDHRPDEIQTEQE
jgi:uncharacterized membrane protein YgaE (UPF0421/DUF939 family)